MRSIVPEQQSRSSNRVFPIQRSAPICLLPPRGTSHVSPRRFTCVRFSRFTAFRSGRARARVRYLAAIRFPLRPCPRITVLPLLQLAGSFPPPPLPRLSLAPRADSQDYGPIVDYAGTGSSQFQWPLPANRNINANWIALMAFPFPVLLPPPPPPPPRHYSRSLFLGSFSFLIRRTSGLSAHHARNGRTRGHDGGKMSMTNTGQTRSLVARE